MVTKDVGAKLTLYSLAFLNPDKFTPTHSQYRRIVHSAIVVVMGLEICCLPNGQELAGVISEEFSPKPIDSFLLPEEGDPYMETVLKDLDETHPKMFSSSHTG